MPHDIRRRRNRTHAANGTCCLRHTSHSLLHCPAGLTRSDPESPSKFAEALLGKEFNSKSLQQFLQHGGEVLRFYCLWDDRQAQYGER